MIALFIIWICWFYLYWENSHWLWFYYKHHILEVIPVFIDTSRPWPLSMSSTLIILLARLVSSANMTIWKLKSHDTWLMNTHPTISYLNGHGFMPTFSFRPLFINVLRHCDEYGQNNIYCQVTIQRIGELLYW